MAGREQSASAGQLDLFEAQAVEAFPIPAPAMRVFATGATRNLDTGKPDYEGFLSPFVVKRFGEYMNRNRLQADGTIRASSNWQLGIEKNAYMSSLWRHFLDVWMQHRGGAGEDSLENSLCAILFNAQGYLFEVLKERKYGT